MRTFTDSWISYRTTLPFRGKAVPNLNKFYLCFADTNLLTRQSSPLDFINAELNQENGYVRSNVLYSEDGTFSITNKRHDLPLVTGSVTALANTIQFQTVFLIGNGNASANKLFNATTDVNINTNSITEPAHGLANGDRISFNAEPASGLPTGLAANTLYRSINVTTDTFQVSIDNLNPVDITALGSGQCRLRYVPEFVVLLEQFDSPQLAQPGRTFYYDLQISGFNTTFGAGV